MSSSVRASPFRETEWDRRFNNLMDDLESSANVKSSVSNYNNSNGNIKDSAPDNVLRDLNSALNASSNYIENHRTESGPGSMAEIHEYKTYSSSVGGPDFDLQEKVQHMMPSSAYSSSSANRSNGYSPLSSANMVSSLQQQQTGLSSSATTKTSYNSRQVQNNSSFSKSEERPGSRLKQNIEELDTLLYDLNNAQKMSDNGGDYTAASSVGQMSSDDYSEGLSRASHSAFNEYAASSSPRRRFPSGGGQALTSPASVRKAAGHQLYQTTTTTTTKTVREHSPFDPQRAKVALDYSRTNTLEGRSNTPGGGSSDYGRTTPIPVVHENSSSFATDHSNLSRSGLSQQECTSTRSGYSQQQQQQEYSSRSATRSTNEHSGRATNNNNNTLMPDLNGRDTPDSEPKGAAYYAKYHSSHSHKSTQGQQSSFPSGRNTPSFPSTGQQQQPPKRVDELMTELSEFDPSIQPTSFVEPRPVNKMAHTTYRVREDDTDYLLKKESNLEGGSGVGQREPMPNVSGPAVYYPPGEMFASETVRDSSASAPLNPSAAATTNTSSSSKKGKSKDKSKGKASDSDAKQGAAVIPICLPLCCAAPCVIM